MPAQKHTYLQTHTIAGTVLALDLKRESAALLEKAASSAARRAAKTLVKQGDLRVTLSALKAGGELQKHLVEGELTVHALSGRARLTAGDREVVLAAGTLVSLAPGVQHDLRASRDTVLLLTMAIAGGA